MNRDFTPEYVALLRRLSPGRKVDIAAAMVRAARAMMTEAARAEHPDWTDEQTTAEVRRRWMHLTDADCAAFDDEFDRRGWLDAWLGAPSRTAEAVAAIAPYTYFPLD